MMTSYNKWSDIIGDNFTKTVNQLLPIKKSTILVWSKNNSLPEKIALLSNNLEQIGHQLIAEKLQLSWSNVKRAQVVLSDILEMAHPNGPVEISESQNENGYMETLESQHQKMLQMLSTKQKNSTALQNIASIFKLSQDTSNLVNLDLNEESDILADPQTKISKINTYLQKKWSEITAKSNETLNLTTITKAEKSLVKFDINQIFKGDSEYLKLFQQYSGVEAKQIVNLVKLYNYLYNGGSFENGLETIIGKINSYPDSEAGYESLIQFGNYIDRTLTNKYFTGVQDPDSKEDQIGNNLKNPNSVWKYFGKDSNKVKEAATAIHQMIKESYDLVNDKITEANQKVQSEVKNLLTPLISLIHGGDQLEQLGGVPQLQNDDKTTGVVIGGLLKILKSIASIANESESGKQLSFLLSKLFAFETENFFISIAYIQSYLNELILNLRNISLSTMDVYYPLDMAKATATNFIQAAKYWEAAIESNSNKAKEYTQYQTMSNALLNAVRKGAGNKYYLTYQNLGPDFSDLKTPQSLQNHSLLWLNKTKEMLKVAIDTRNINIKIAAPLPGGSAATPTGPAKPTAPNTNTSTTTTSSNTGVSISEKRQVQMMQQMLYEAGVYLQSGKYKDYFGIKNLPETGSLLLNTGKKVGDYYGDGIWGSQTARALQAFKKAALSFVKKDQPGYRSAEIEAIIEGPYLKKPDVITIAKKNCTAIANFNNMLAGKPTLDGVGLETLITLDSFNGLNITNQDLQTLGNFYLFTIKNKLIEKESVINPQAENPTTGVNAGTFAQLLTTLTGRAKDAYQAKVDNAAKYYQQMINLYKKYLAIIQGYKIPWDALVPESLLLGQSKGVGSNSRLVGNDNNNASGNGLANNPANNNGQENITSRNTSGNKRKPGQGGGNEGVDYGSTLTPENPKFPINDTIDLSLNWYQGIRQSYPNINPYLQMNLFRKYSLEDLANAYFPSNSDPQRDFYNFINYLSKAMNQAVQFWIEDDQPSQEIAETCNNYRMQWETILKKLRRQFEQLRGK